MKISFEILELIKKYVNGELDDEKRASLEQMLVERPELQEEVDMARMLVEETENLERERIMEVIKEVHSASEKDTDHRETKIFSLNKKVWLSAAAAIIILLGSFWWWSNQEASLEDEIFAFQENAYTAPSGDLVRSSSTETNIDNAYREYLEKNYTISIEWLNTISNEDSLYLLALHLKGHNYYLSKNYSESIKVFDEILEKQATGSKYKSPSMDNVSWTKILVILSQYRLNPSESKKSDMDKTLSDFMKIANPNDIYYKKAIELEKILD